VTATQQAAVPRVPILMYHSIGGADRLAVSPEAFAEQLAILAEHGFTPITFGDLVRRATAVRLADGGAMHGAMHGAAVHGAAVHGGAVHGGADGGVGAGRDTTAGRDGARRDGRAAVPSGVPGPGAEAGPPRAPADLPGHASAPGGMGGSAGSPGVPGAGGGMAGRPVVLTFDDGYADFHERALPLLARYGFPATLFVTTGWLRDAGPYAAGRPPGRTLSWGELEEVAAAGIEIGGHGHSHAQLDQLGDRTLREELRLGRELLEDRLGRAVPTMAYPYGYSSARVRRAVRETGYAAACVVGNALPGAGHDVLTMPRLTVRAATSTAGFARALEGRGYLVDHALTKGYAIVRRSRYAVRRLRGVT
jgi:hypothetical protein